MAEKLIELNSVDTALAIFGSCDENIRCWRANLELPRCAAYPDQVHRRAGGRGGGGPCSGCDAHTAGKSYPPGGADGALLHQLAGAGEESRVQELTEDFVAITAKGRPVRPKTLGQKEYLNSIRKNAHHLRCGPRRYRQDLSGGCHAVKAFKSKEVTRII